jgi:hypothetical protein
VCVCVCLYIHLNLYPYIYLPVYVYIYAACAVVLLSTIALPQYAIDAFVHAPASAGNAMVIVLQSRTTKCETVDGTAASSTALCLRDQPPSQQVHPPRPPLNFPQACGTPAPAVAVGRSAQQRLIELVSQPCQAGSCGEQFLWRATEWGPCDSSCGRGVMNRLVECLFVASDGARPLLLCTWTRA